MSPSTAGNDGIQSLDWHAQLLQDQACCNFLLHVWHVWLCLLCAWVRLPTALKQDKHRHRGTHRHTDTHRHTQTHRHRHTQPPTRLHHQCRCVSSSDANRADTVCGQSASLFFSLAQSMMLTAIPCRIHRISSDLRS